MKASIPTLSVEQRRAQEKYKLAIVPAMFFTFCGYLAISTIIVVVLGHFSLLPGPTFIVPLMFVAFPVANFWAVREVRRSGLSLESRKIEILELTNPNFNAENKAWWQPKTFSAAIGNVVLLWLFSAGGWGLWHYGSSFIGAVAFFLFLWAGIVGLVFVRSPRVQIDENGVAVLDNLFWRRRASWNCIARCEIHTFYNLLGQGPSQIFVFKAASGKMLLRLSPLAPTGVSNGLSREEQAEIDREIRKRFESATADEADSQPI